MYDEKQRSYVHYRTNFGGFGKTVDAPSYCIAGFTAVRYVERDGFCHKRIRLVYLQHQSLYDKSGSVTVSHQYCRISVKYVSQSSKSMGFTR